MEQQQQQQQPHQHANLWRLSAVEAVEALRAGRVTPLQLVNAAEQRWKVCVDMACVCTHRSATTAQSSAAQLTHASLPAAPPPPPPPPGHGPPRPPHTRVHGPPLQDTEPAINAMPITCWERARQQARNMMAAGFPAQPPCGYLFGACGGARGSSLSLPAARPVTCPRPRRCLGGCRSACGCQGRDRCQGAAAHIRAFVSC
jgi:hypothetical protein